MVKSCSSVMAIAHCFVLVLWHHCPCLFLVSAFPLCHWQGVEKLVHYFCDKAWYSTTSDFFPSLPHAFSLLCWGFFWFVWLFFSLCMMHVYRRCACGFRISHCFTSLVPQKYYKEKMPLFHSTEVLGYQDGDWG